MNRITCSILSVLQCRHTVLESAPTSVFATEQGKKHCSRKSRWAIGTKNLGLGYEVATTKIPRDSSWLVRQEGYLMACQRGNSEVGPSTGAADLCPHFRRVQPGCWCCFPTHTEVTESITKKKRSLQHLDKTMLGATHSVTMLSTCCLMGTATGIHMKRVDFSDPQGSKGACNRIAATITTRATIH